MKSRVVVIGLGAVAIATFFMIRSGRAAPSNGSGAENDSGLVTMSEAPERDSNGIAPRVVGAVIAESTGITTPTKRTSVSSKAPRTKATATTPVFTASRPIQVPVAPATAAAPVPPPERVSAPGGTPAPARAPAPGRLTLQPGSRLAIDGKSSVKDFTCKTSTLEATVITSKPDAAAAIVAAERSVTSVELRVPVAALDCDNGTMNDHMRNALDAKAHPTIVFALSSYELASVVEGTAVTLNGALTIHGEAKPVSFVALASTADGALHLTGAYELNMKDYGVKPPSLMLGTMKVRDKVKVRFDLLLRD